MQVKLTTAQSARRADSVSVLSLSRLLLACCRRWPRANPDFYSGLQCCLNIYTDNDSRRRTQKIWQYYFIDCENIYTQCEASDRRDRERALALSHSLPLSQGNAQTARSMHVELQLIGNGNKNMASGLTTSWHWKHLYYVGQCRGSCLKSSSALVACILRGKLSYSIFMRYFCNAPF